MDTQIAFIMIMIGIAAAHAVEIMVGAVAVEQMSEEFKS